MRVALKLTRLPLLIPSTTPLQEAAHKYYRDLRFATSSQFPSTFYFRPGSKAEAHFQETEVETQLRSVEDVLRPDEKIKRSEQLARASNDLDSYPDQTVTLYKINADTKDLELPSTEMKPGETMIQAAKRSLLDLTKERDDDVDIWFPMNGPSNFLKSKNSYVVDGVILAGGRAGSTDFCWKAASEHVGSDSKA